MNKNEQSGTYASDEYDAYCECDECEPEDDVTMTEILALLFVGVIIVVCLGWLVL